MQSKQNSWTCVSKIVLLLNIMSDSGKVKSVAIIGAGPAGITCAYELARYGIRVEVFESSGEVGGMARTIKLWGQEVDLGPHRFFSDDIRVNNLWLEVVGHDYKMVNRLTRIYYKGKFYYYPIKAFDVLLKLGFFTASACLFSYLSEKIKPTKQEGTLESWITHKFGKRLFELFFKSYSEKLWGIACNEVDADFAAQRIKGFSLGEAIKKAMGMISKNHKTLVDQFAYPHHGTGMVYERMRDSINNKGGKVKCNLPIKGVVKTNGVANGIELENGEIKFYDQIVSTMPINVLINNWKDVPKDILSYTNSLKFRNTILVYLQIDGKDIFPDNWIYVHSNEIRTGRITNFRNFPTADSEKTNTSIIALEYWCNSDEPIWAMPDKELIELAKGEIKTIQIINGAQVLNGHVEKIAKCYPIYNRNYKVGLKPIEKYLSNIKGLTVIGRNGAFKYNNQDHSILMGILAAENIAKDANHNLWEINTDYETYQEKSSIDATGLVILK